MARKRRLTVRRLMALVVLAALLCLPARRQGRTWRYTIGTSGLWWDDHSIAVGLLHGPVQFGLGWQQQIARLDPFGPIYSARWTFHCWLAGPWGFRCYP